MDASSATAEKHYTVRPLDLLRVHLEKIEAWILEQAGITIDDKAEPGKLRVVGRCCTDQVAAEVAPQPHGGL